MPKYIIEHLEKELHKWCCIEYKNISKIVGKENLIIINIKNSKERKKLLEIAKEVKAESVKEMKLKNICLFDMEAEKEFSRKDKFEYLIFGGILGDNPPQKRTQKFFAESKIERRHLGKMQMPTDNAVLTAKMVAEGKALSEIKFIDNPTFEIEKGLELNLPYRFVEINKKPFISKELLEHIKKAGF